MNTASVRIALYAMLLVLLVSVSIGALPQPAHADNSLLTGFAGGFAGGIAAQAVTGGLSGLNSSLNGVGMGADTQCFPVIPTCPCNQVPNPKGGCMPGQNKYMCPNICVDRTNGTTMGTCVAPGKCQGTSFSGLGGGSGGQLGMQLLQQALGSLMQKLLQGGQGGGSGGGAGGAAPVTNPTGCASYYQVTQPSTDPCAYYVPPVSSTLNGTNTSNVSDQLLGALGTGTGSTDTGTNTNVSDILSQTPTTLSTTPVPATTTIVASSSVQVPTVVGSGLTPGVSGDIKTLGSGATVLAGSTDVSGNTTVAGFYGADSTFGTQPQGIVATLCQNRPWAGNFLSKIIPASFFDGLCTLRGYQVGAPAAAPSKPVITVTQSAPKPVATTTSATTTNTIAPKVSIWASPATVPLGSRTTIFWNSQGVASCTETSPDGSFSEAKLSGAASTVPITGTTVFTISCIAPDGSHVTDNATVTLTI